MNKPKMVSVPQPPSHRINITRGIIDTASPEHAGTCMVAIALRKHVPGCRSISVDASSIRFNADGYRYCYQTPGRVATQISQFDDDKSKVVPFGFVLQAVQCTVAPIRTIGRSKGKKSHTKRAVSCERRCKRRYHGIVTTMPIKAKVKR